MCNVIFIFVVIYFTLVINMSNVRKRKISISKRHFRRIIEDKTNIEIQQDYLYKKKKIGDNDLGLHKICDINIHAFDIFNDTLNIEIVIS